MTGGVIHRSLYDKGYFLLEVTNYHSFVLIDNLRKRLMKSQYLFRISAFSFKANCLMGFLVRSCIKLKFDHLNVKP